MRYLLRKPRLPLKKFNAPTIWLNKLTIISNLYQFKTDVLRVLRQGNLIDSVLVINVRENADFGHTENVCYSFPQRVLHD